VDPGGRILRFSPSHWIEKEENDEELKIKVSTQRPIAELAFNSDAYT
jgi:hypothetical protein